MEEPAIRDVARSRIVTAVALSAALHLSFIYGIAPRPGARARPIAPLAARLIPEMIPETPAPAASRLTPAPPLAVERVASSVLSVPAAAPEVPLVSTPPSNGAQRFERREDSVLPKADLPFPVDLQWYEGRDLDTYPRANSSLDAPYPAFAQAEGVRGTVTLLLAIDETGAVHDASIVNAEPPGYFEEAALNCARRAQFVPGEKDGHPVRSRIIVKLRYAPQDPAPR